MFAGRLGRSLALVVALIGLSLAVGMAGYIRLEGHMPIDAFAEAAMILSGMGPLSSPQTEAGKLFAGVYALYSGLFLVATAGLILTPVLHRVIHQFHAADDGDDG